MHLAQRAFTFIEIAMVIIVIGILAAIVVPTFGTVTDEARTSATQSTLASVRTSIAGFRSAQLLAGGSPYPTLAQLTTSGTVLEQEIPANPFTGISGVQLVSLNAAQTRTVTNPGQYGWNYYVDNAATPPICIFYSNSDKNTTVPGNSGGTRKASEL